MTHPRKGSIPIVTSPVHQDTTSRQRPLPAASVFCGGPVRHAVPFRPYRVVSAAHSLSHWTKPSPNPQSRKAAQAKTATSKTSSSPANSLHKPLSTSWSAISLTLWSRPFPTTKAS
eukprot:03621_4